jgi:uncharacterized protein YecT (DUF1311 family)
MTSFRASFRKSKVSSVFSLAALCLIAVIFPRTAASHRSQDSQPAPASPDDQSIFQNPIPADQLAFLKQFAGAPAKNLVRDKHFRKLMRTAVPDCIFHYGWDISLPDALEKVLNGSHEPVQLRDSRYLMVSGHNGPYLSGRGFMWFDLQDGIAIGGFFFHPTNGEPTPTVTVFSSQVKEKALVMSQLPPAFSQDLSKWSQDSKIAPVTTRYFITANKEKILLEHDEDYCAPADRTPAHPANVCQQRNADAADIDLNAAYYLEQTNHATNATAWMIVGAEQVAWIQVRDSTCSLGPAALPCHIRLTRERTHIIIRRYPIPHSPHS